MNITKPAFEQLQGLAEKKDVSVICVQKTEGKEQYAFLTAGLPSDVVQVAESLGVKIVVPAAQASVLESVSIDYQYLPGKTGFVITGAAAAGCGCGKLQP